MAPVRCFIVDDDLSFGRSLKRLLDAEGYVADVFVTGQQFLDFIHPGQSGYAIVDIHLPEFDGFSLIAKMRELRYEMPVILLTGQTQADTRDMALDEGAIGLLQKPFRPESLLDLMNRYESELLD